MQIPLLPTRVWNVAALLVVWGVHATLTGTSADAQSTDATTADTGSLSRVHYGWAFEEDFKPALYIETVQPLYNDPEYNRTIFIQPRVNYNGTDQDYYNLGGGWREYLPDANALVGVNVFGDYQRDPGFGRFGVGGEWLGDVVDARINGYFRLGPRRMIEETATEVIYERVANGLDAEAGVRLPYLPYAKIFGGGEFYDFKYGDNVHGWQGRLELAPFSFTTINVRYADDSVSDGRWAVDARVSFALDDLGRAGKWFSPEPWSRRDARERALDRVERKARIVRERYGVSKATGITFLIGRSG